MPRAEPAASCLKKGRLVLRLFRVVDLVILIWGFGFRIWGLEISNAPGYWIGYGGVLHYAFVRTRKEYRDCLFRSGKAGQPTPPHFPSSPTKHSPSSNLCSPTSTQPISRVSPRTHTSPPLLQQPIVQPNPSISWSLCEAYLNQALWWLCAQYLLLSCS